MTTTWRGRDISDDKVLAHLVRCKAYVEVYELEQEREIAAMYTRRALGLPPVEPPPVEPVPVEPLPVEPPTEEPLP